MFNFNSQAFKCYPPPETQLTNFINCPSKPALLSLIPAHSDSYIPKSVNPELPVVWSSLFDNSLPGAFYPTLLKKSEEPFELLEVTKKQQELMEEKTREQASSRFRMRAGQITASKFKNACHTDPTCPSHSLIMSICHPEISRFNTEATKWGCHYEKRAKDAYYRYQKEMHVNFSVRIRSLSKN